MNKTTEEIQQEIEELKSQIEHLKSCKRYGLVWEDKKEEFDELSRNSFPVLTAKNDDNYPNISSNNPSNQKSHILIEGDNYHALSILSYTHKGKVDVIYIDPPYNTGARDWKYNNDYVDGEDTFRHSKWLSFMDKRLRIAKEVLSDDGVICVTIDDYELPRLWLLMEDVFNEANHLGTVSIRNNPKGRMTKRKFSLVHEYAVFFGKTNKSYIKKLPVKPEDKTHNYKEDTDGRWFVPVNLRKQGVDSNAINKKGKLSHRFYPIYFDPGSGNISTTEKYQIEILPIDSNGVERIWRRGIEAIEQMFKDGDLMVKETRFGYQIHFKFRGGLDGRMAQSIWSDAKFSASEYGTKTLDNILGEREVFQYPKSPEAVKESILASSNKDSAIVLDFFAGSGTTGHAVLELNKDGGSRQFILVTNNENNICEDVTYKRIKRVMQGYTNNKGVGASGLGGELVYLKTDFVNKQNNETVTDEDKIKLTYKVGSVLALKENTFNEVKKSTYYQIFSSSKQLTAIYFSENKADLSELVDYLANQGKPCKLYLFSWTKGEYKHEFNEYENITAEDIPEPILDVYKSIGVI